MTRPRRRARERYVGLLFLAPLLVLIGVFYYAPLALTVGYSFQKYDGISPPESVGFDNYLTLIQSSEFHRILFNELILVCGLVIWVTVPLFLAIALYGRRHAGWIRAILFIPPLLPAVTVSSAFRTIFADRGPINSLLEAMGFGPVAVQWLTSDFVVLFTIMLVILWATMGTGVLLYSGSLATMDPSLREAAIVDGATWRQVAWYIYRPHLRAVTRFWVIILTVATVTSFFPYIFPLTNGGPGIASTTVDYKVWAAGIRDGQIGLASAIAVVNLAIVALLLGLQFLVRWANDRRN